MCDEFLVATDCLCMRLFNTPLLWVGAASPSPALVMFYLGKVGTHLEDLLVIVMSLVFPQEGVHTDAKMILHHVATALLCIGSWCSGYLRIGSAIMLLHDVSDVPLDLVRVCGVVNQKTLQIASMVLTLLAWGYWRWVVGQSCMHMHACMHDVSDAN
jgi:hypothetical protein